MQINWNEKSVRWFKDASEYTGFNKELCRLLAPYLSTGKTLCDIGCGSGLIDLELAPLCKHITCVDICENAVSGLSQEALSRGHKNLSVKITDGKLLTEHFDIVFSFFHGGCDCFDDYFPLANELMIIATHSDKESKTGPAGKHVRKHHNAEKLRAHLNELGVRYTSSVHSIEYGQPLRDLSDAAEYVAAYSLSLTSEEMNAYLKSALVKTGRDDFLYYLPKKRNFELFIIPKG